MRPFVVILGIVLGSLVSIAFSLSVVLLIFLILRSDSPRVAAELPELARGALMFLLLAACAGMAFIHTLRGHRARYAFLCLLWIGLLGAGWYYWPD
jgi:hypothetical protein